MGFYQPFTLIKDAQRHGLKVLPVDDGQIGCAMIKRENRDGETGTETGRHLTPTRPSLREGFYRLRPGNRKTGDTPQPFTGIDDLTIVFLNCADELRKLAAVVLYVQTLAPPSPNDTAHTTGRCFMAGGTLPATEGTL